MGIEKKYMQNQVKSAVEKYKKRPQFPCFDRNCILAENMSKKIFLTRQKNKEPRLKIPILSNSQNWH